MLVAIAVEEIVVALVLHVVVLLLLLVYTVNIQLYNIQSYNKFVYVTPATGPVTPSLVPLSKNIQLYPPFQKSLAITWKTVQCAEFAFSLNQFDD